MNTTKEVYESREDMRNVLKRSEAENKKIKKTLLKTLALNTEQVLRLKAIKDSRNELLHWLEVISVHVKDSQARNAVNIICAKAQALKEKESK